MILVNTDFVSGKTIETLGIVKGSIVLQIELVVHFGRDGSENLRCAPPPHIF